MFRSVSVRMRACILGWMASLAAASCAWAAGPQTVMVPMRDGVKLATDIYLPSGSGPFPAVVVRTPYGKGMGAALASVAAAHGLALVVQDTRGRFASEGANLPFEADGWNDGTADGYDTVEWVARQPWCSGKIGTWGPSALGITQLLMAGTNPPHLTCQVIIVGSPSFYKDATYPGGVFKRAMIEDWLRATRFEPQALQTWVAHSTYDDYWKSRDLSRRWSWVNVPALHIGGWYDIFTQGTLDAFMGYQHKGGPGARGKQRLVMGPWTHGVGSRTAGALTYPPNASAPPNHADDAWRWFDHYLLGKANGVGHDAPVVYYVMGDVTDPHAPGNEWRTASDWPVPSTATRYYLHEDRSVSTARPSERAAALTYTYDPKDPTPGIGGPQLTIPAGPQKQNAIEARPDVLSFTSAVLTDPLEVTGRVKAELWVRSDAPDTDFFVRLCDVYPDGTSYNVCEGQLRARFRDGFDKEHLLTPGRLYRLNVDLWSTSIIFNRGHRLRVDIASASVPGYDPNPNTGAPFRSSTDTRIAHNTIVVESSHPSCVVLPVVSHGR